MPEKSVKEQIRNILSSRWSSEFEKEARIFEVLNKHACVPRKQLEEIVKDFDSVNLMHHSEIREWYAKVKALLEESEKK